MHHTILLLVLVSAPPEPALRGGTSPVVDGHPPVAASQRTLHAINADIRSSFRDEVRAKTDAERAAAVFRMTELYQEIRRHPNAAVSPTLKEYKAKLWSRLTRVKRGIQRQLARDEGGKTPAGPPELDAAQDARVTLAAASLADHLQVVGATMGGPTSVFSQRPTARGGGAIPDYGPALVSLIERTISPEFWDVRGGPGTIVYYQPLMALVVRATSEVHHNVGGALGGLRAAR